MVRDAIAVGEPQRAGALMAEHKLQGRDSLLELRSQPRREPNARFVIVDRFRLDGRVAVVTGATCELGVAIARTLGAAGAHIALAGRRLNDVEARCAGLRDDGIDATAFRVDVADHESCTAAITEIMERFGRVDVLVNNAGVGNAAPATRDDYPAQFRHTMEVNLMGAYWMSQACGRVMHPGSAS